MVGQKLKFKCYIEDNQEFYNQKVNRKFSKFDGSLLKELNLRDLESQPKTF